MASPSPNTIKAHLTNAIRKADLTTVSAKQIRRIVEKELNLPDNELSSEKWKAEVKKWIQEALGAIDADEGLERGVQEVEEVDEGVTDEVVKKGKGRKVIVVTPESSPVRVKSPRQTPPKKNVPKKEEKEEEKEEGETMSPPTKKRKMEEDEASDSDMSILIDSTPPKQKSSKQTKSKSVKQIKSWTKPSSTEDEIKHLKSLIYKCGLRKNWTKELSSMSDKDQIPHLREILRDLGMTGRLSVEKARKIKEERELREELEFIQEGARNVGEPGEGRRRRSGG